MFEGLSNILSDEKSKNMHVEPTIEEVYQAFMGLNRHSAGGPDGMTDAFYQGAREIIKYDVYDMVKAFFPRAELPRFVTHMNLVLSLKKVNASNFSDPRPISLSNFVNKILSRIVHEIIKKILQKIISNEQDGFVQGRCIAENVLLVQEIITEIRKGGKPANLVIKFDMIKAYDRVE